jgi:hypothetical protein
VIEKLSDIETIQNDIGYISSEPNGLKERTLKIDKLYDGTEYVRKCGDCMHKTSSSHWNTDAFVVGGHLCQKCYRRRRRHTTEELQGRNIPPMRSCTGCDKSDQTSIWFKHPSIPYRYVCENCCSSIKSITIQGKATNKLVHNNAKRIPKGNANIPKQKYDPYPISISRTQSSLLQGHCLSDTLKPLY